MTKVRDYSPSLFEPKEAGAVLEAIDRKPGNGGIGMAEVGMAELKVVRSPGKLEALGVGSCIIITFHDMIIRAGALAHIMLPDSKKAAPSTNPFKFADLAIDEMLKQMKNLGSRREDIVAKIVGGANMFPNIKHGPNMPMGEQNVKAVKEKLEKEGIKLGGEDIGGTSGRSVEFDTVTGIVTIRKKI